MVTPVLRVDGDRGAPAISDAARYVERGVIGGRRLVPDFRWPDLNLIVEADSQEWHGDPIARAEDLERQAFLEAHGERLIRITSDDVVLQPRQSVRRIELAGAPFSSRL